MILNDKELDKLIEEYEKKSEEAYRNYQDTGYSRHWNTHKKYDDLADTLKVARNYKEATQRSRSVISDMKQWAWTISQMPHMSQERKEAETITILNGIIACVKSL